MRSTVFALAAGMLLAAAAQPALAEKKYGPGVTDTEIKLGQTMPYSGPSSAVGMVGKVEVAYFKMINAQGGVNGRQINMISLDDGFSPPKTVEQTRKLVEEENVLAIVSSVGSGPNLAIAKYLNSKKVPHILLPAGTPKLVDPVNLPWTTAFYSTLAMEGREFAAYMLEAKPNAKIGILYQNDESGKSYVDGMKGGLGDKAAAMVVKEVSFDLTDPTIDSQILSLQAAGADTVYFATTSPKFAAQGIRKIYDLGWKAQMLLVSSVSQVEATLKPAGLDRSVGAITTIFLKMPADPLWQNDKAMQDYYAFMKQWAPEDPPGEALAEFGYIIAQMTVELLKRCGDDLTRENLMYQATHVSDLQLPLYVPGVKINITPESRVPWKQARMARFDGTSWQFVSGIVTASGEK
jgi:ABC-type branched-subunit amino acid transport system substrate-binding protein